ncbi:hypothetical protein Ocin01_18086 [Orchesella cincta]|uniref:Uncharacterized protein n=1 Tax=Orchesella cincta TaxID=48709 RepID=A0A1D2M6J1_ORCCI|nr:hypothetical protein Ocin01_18086 [Orchesella cincta]
MLEMDCKETKEKAIKLEMSGKGVEALLKFIYYSNVDDPMEHPRVALELMEVGNQYDILGLEKAMKDIFLGQRYDWFDIDTAVLLYNWTLKVDGNEDLKWKAIQVFKSNLGDLEGSTEFDKLMKEFPQAAKKFIALCFASYH